MAGVDRALTRVETAALLAVAQDHAFGQSAGAQLRAVVIGQRLAAAAGLDSAERATTWWTSALRFLGCTGHAFESAVVFGDEIDLRSRALRADSANPTDEERYYHDHLDPSVNTWDQGRLPSWMQEQAQENNT